MTKKSTLWLLLAVVTLAVFALSACAPAATEAPPAATAPEEEAPPPEVEPTEAPPPEAEPTEAAPPAEAEETTVTILIPDNPVAFNGINTDTGYEQMIGELVMLAVAEADPNGNIFPELAAELPTIENGGVELDEEAWTMAVTWKLRDDIFWADGEQVTADDVVFTWDALLEAEAWTEGMDYTDSVEKIDDFTFKVNYNYVYPNYLLQFGGENFFVYPEHYCDIEQGFYEWDCDQQPLSDGPFILEEWVTDDHLTFVRNENYFDAGKPGVDKVVIRIVPEESVRETIMLEGDADVHYWPDDQTTEVYKETDYIDYSIAPSERWVMRLVPNLTAYGETDPEANPHPFLSDVRVRQAIRMAIDVDTIVNEIHYGNGKPTWTEFFREPYVCDIPKPAFDPEGAVALLEEAGWVDTNDDGIRECQGCPNAEDGTPMTMEFTIYSEYGESLELAQQYIAENLGDVGIGTELLSIEGAIMWAPAEDGGTELSGNFELDMWDDGYPGVDPTDFVWWFYYSAATPEEGGYNVGRWANEDFDLWMDEAYTLDEEYRKEVFCELANILEDELPWILLYTTLDQYGVNTRVVGIQPSVNDPLTWNVAEWSVSE
jgi:peptide/nickel transport system substrate-binding protein